MSPLAPFKRKDKRVALGRRTGKVLELNYRCDCSIIRLDILYLFGLLLTLLETQTHLESVFKLHLEQYLRIQFMQWQISICCLKFSLNSKTQLSGSKCDLKLVPHKRIRKTRQ